MDEDGLSFPPATNFYLLPEFRTYGEWGKEIEFAGKREQKSTQGLGNMECNWNPMDDRGTGCKLKSKSIGHISIIFS